MIEDLRRKFSVGSKGEQDLLLHDDPVALASELAEVAWCEIDEQRFDAFIAERKAGGGRFDEAVDP